MATADTVNATDAASERRACIFPEVCAEDGLTVATCAFNELALKVPSYPDSDIDTVDDADGTSVNDAPPPGIDNVGDAGATTDAVGTPEHPAKATATHTNIRNGRYVFHTLIAVRRHAARFLPIKSDAWARFT